MIRSPTSNRVVVTGFGTLHNPKGYLKPQLRKQCYGPSSLECELQVECIMTKTQARRQSRPMWCFSTRGRARLVERLRWTAGSGKKGQFKVNLSQVHSPWLLCTSALNMLNDPPQHKTPSLLPLSHRRPLL